MVDLSVLCFLSEAESQMCLMAFLRREHKLLFKEKAVCCCCKSDFTTSVLTVWCDLTFLSNRHLDTLTLLWI